MPTEQVLKEASLKIKKRIKKEMAAKNINQQDLVNETGIHKSEISLAVNGNTGKRFEEIRGIIYEKLGISSEDV